MTTKSSSSRAERGRRAEEVVVEYLRAHGYAVVGRNRRLGRLEIDIIARRGPVVCVVEVRTRGNTSYLPALATLSRAKQARMLRAADRLWQDELSRQPDVARLRIDVAAVYFGAGPPVVEYFEGAISHS